MELEFNNNGVDDSKVSRRVCFANVEVFYFERAQGFLCIPSLGGSSLGMAGSHCASEKLPICDFERAKRIEKYSILFRKFKKAKINLTPRQLKWMYRFIAGSSLSVLQSSICANLSLLSDLEEFLSSLRDETEMECDVMSSSLYMQHNSEIRTQLDGKIESELAVLLDSLVLQSLSIRKRRVLLRKSGLLTIDSAERMENQSIRVSREVCGCSCPGGICSPEYCLCVQNGIKCQVDRTNFPCSCSYPINCHNPEGRVEFNPTRVRAHYVHTRMRFGQQEGRCSELDIHDNFWLDQDEERPPTKRFKRTDEPSMLSSEELSCSPKTEQEEDANCIARVNEPTATNANGSSNDFSFTTTIATTTDGGCPVCQNDRYVQMLVPESVLVPEPPPIPALIGDVDQNECFLQYIYQNPPDPIVELSDATDEQVSFNLDTSGSSDDFGRTGGNVQPALFNDGLDSGVLATSSPSKTYLLTHSDNNNVHDNTDSLSQQYINGTMRALPNARSQQLLQDQYYYTTSSDMMIPTTSNFPSLPDFSFSDFNGVLVNQGSYAEEVPLNRSQQHQLSNVDLLTPYTDAHQFRPRCPLEPISSLFASSTYTSRSPMVDYSYNTISDCGFETASHQPLQTPPSTPPCASPKNDIGNSNNNKFIVADYDDDYVASNVEFDQSSDFENSQSTNETVYDPCDLLEMDPNCVTEAQPVVCAREIASSSPLRRADICNSSHNSSRATSPMVETVSA